MFEDIVGFNLDKKFNFNYDLPFKLFYFWSMNCTLHFRYGQIHKLQLNIEK